jgi:predicted DNA-binding transcriptional regulator AlpA
MKQYLTVKELADHLNVCRASVYNYLKTIPGFPQPLKIGRMSRWNFEEIELFMKNAPRGVSGENPCSHFPAGRSDRG